MSTLRRLASSRPPSRASPLADGTPGPAHATDVALLTDPGPVRDHNEDRLLSAAQDDGNGPPRVHWLALADGMGGHRAGQVASELALETARAAYAAGGGRVMAQRLRAALLAANAEVHRVASAHAEQAGMGTTLVMAAVTDHELHYAWAGDSRLYHWRAGRLRQLTQDDTVVNRLLLQGLVTDEEAARHPERHVLWQAIGARAEIPEPHVGTPLRVETDDRLLLCSDGLYDVVPDALIESTLGEGSALDAGSALMRLALGRGTEDNVSVAVLRFYAVEAGRPRPRPTAELRTL